MSLTASRWNQTQPIVPVSTGRWVHTQPIIVPSSRVFGSLVTPAMIGTLDVAHPCAILYQRLNYSVGQKFSIIVTQMHNIVPPDGSLICVRYLTSVDGGTTVVGHRYKLTDFAESNLAVPMYTGEVIYPLFSLETWNMVHWGGAQTVTPAGTIATTLPASLNSSVFQPTSSVIATLANGPDIPLLPYSVTAEQYGDINLI